MFRFEEVILKDCPPIGDIDIAFDEHLTVIAGGNASGKPALNTALKTGHWPYGGTVELITRGSRKGSEGAEPLAFLDDSILFPGFHFALAPTVAAELETPKYWHRLGAVLASDLKLSPTNCRYRGTPYRGSGDFRC